MAEKQKTLFRAKKEKTHSFSRNTKYYEGIVHEFNLPAGHACPGALQCRVMVDRLTGKFRNDSDKFRCYAASAERFPSARNSRWRNFDYVKAGNKPEIPKNCKAIRIHASGDFFSQNYFDMWLEIARENPTIEFWAYTKSINFWIPRIDDIPDNLTLTASRGSKFDILIDQYKLKNATVVKPSNIKFVTKNTAYFKNKLHQIDYGDDVAREKGVSFLLLDNHEPIKHDDFDETFIEQPKVEASNNNNYSYQASFTFKAK